MTNSTAAKILPYDLTGMNDFPQWATVSEIDLTERDFDMSDTFLDLADNSYVPGHRACPIPLILDGYTAVDADWSMALEALYVDPWERTD